MADTKEISKINLDNTLYDIKDNAAREAANKKLDTTTTETQTVAGNVNFNNTVKAKELFENDQRVITGATESKIIFTTEGEKPDFSIEEDEENNQMYFKFQLPKGLETVQTSLDNKAPKEHSFTSEMLEKGDHYGLGTDKMYGHIKLSDDYDFEDGDAAAGIGASQFALFNAYTELINRPKVTYLIDTITPTTTTDLFTSDSFENYDFFIIQTPSYSNKTDSVGYYYCAPTCTIISLDKLKEGSTIAFKIPGIVPSVTVPDSVITFSIKYINENTINYSPATFIISLPITIIGIKL